ncbi:hypothetical protein SUGI_1190390 [Cryptomeria japonica]|nr:hypothetical protein SUGI_1190390 [Cryptomeria japonica]
MQSISGRNSAETPSAISISSIPACKIRDSLPLSTMASLADGFCEDVMCAVCLSSIHKDEKIWRLINCRHIFHRECLDKWIENYQNTCPLCRSSLLPKQRDF